ncbi:MAG: hypothetical protein GXY82_01075 [Methanospirillum sp.]|nr:hypothetical protein [Methanospirillum sp.]
MRPTLALPLLSLLLLMALTAPLAAGADEPWVFAYRPGCGSCERALPAVEAFREAHPEQPVELLDLSSGPDAVERFGVLSNRTGTRPSIPVLFAGDQAVWGVEKIGAFLNRTTAASTPPTTREGGGPAPPLTPLVVASAGLVDGINPCAFAVLALLLGTLVASGTRRRVLVLGAAYTAGVFTIYLAAGLGIVTVVGAAGIAPSFRVAAGAVALLLGLAVLAVSVLDLRGLAPAIPEAGRRSAARWIDASRTAGPLAALALGAGVGLVELPCTGGVYLGVLGLLAGASPTSSYPLLVLYNLCFVFPLVLIVGAVAFGLSPSAVDRWRAERRRLVLAASGAVMVVLGLAVLALELG